MTIPAELIAVPQWVLWRSETRPGAAKPTKVPYNTAGHTADITDPSNFADYGKVYNGNAIGYAGIGFVLTKVDVYTAIDLDDPYASVVNGEVVIVTEADGEAWEAAQSVHRSHMKIVEHLNSYTEWSPSKRGLRIFIKGKLPDGWRNRLGKVEIYSHSRFMTVTGWHVEGTPLTIEDRQEELEDVARSLGLDKGGTDGSDYVSQPQTRDDLTVYNAICNSAIGAKFKALYQGEGCGHGRDSENDLILANYIAFFTNNKEQCERIFRLSGHYQLHTKLHTRDDLVTRAVNKAFDQKAPPIDISQMTVNAAQLDTIAPANTETPQIAAHQDGLNAIPPGILGYIMYYIHSSAPRPIMDFSLAGAIGLMGGITGRAYNVRGAGLNQYVAMLGPSTVGKDAIDSGIAKLLSQTAAYCPSARQFKGPSTISSAPALLKAFAKSEGGTPSFVSIVGEFGRWINEHNDARANDTKRGVYTALLKVYGLSGKGHETGSIIYSDRDKNIESTLSPSLSLIGESVPDSFFAACSEENISNGFMPRFLIFNYLGMKPPLNLGHHMFKGTDADIRSFADFCNYCHQLNEKDTPVDVRFDADADRIFADYLTYTDAKNNEHLRDPAGAIWGRAYVKAMKLAALRAVGQSPYSPCINAADAEWAIALANRDVAVLVGKLNEGAIADARTVSGHDPRQRAIAHCFLTHVTRPHAQLKGRLQEETSPVMHDQWKMMRYSRLKNMVMLRAPWSKAANPAVRDREFDSVLKDMSDVLKVNEAHELINNDLGLMWSWGVKEQSTKLVRASADIDALKRLCEDE